MRTNTHLHKSTHTLHEHTKTPICNMSVLSCNPKFICQLEKAKKHRLKSLQWHLARTQHRALLTGKVQPTASGPKPPRTIVNVSQHQIPNLLETSRSPPPVVHKHTKHPPNTAGYSQHLHLFSLSPPRYCIVKISEHTVKSSPLFCSRWTLCATPNTNRM